MSAFSRSLRADCISITWVMLLVNASGALSYLLVIADGSLSANTNSVAFFCIFLGLFSSQVYIFVVTLFTSIHFGKLVGIVNLLGGVTSLISNVLYDTITISQRGGDPLPVMKGIFTTTCCIFVVLVPMVYFARQKLKRIKSSQVIRETKKNSGSVGSYSLGPNGSNSASVSKMQQDFTPQPAKKQVLQPAPLSPFTVDLKEQEAEPNTDDERLSVTISDV